MGLREEALDLHRVNRGKLGVISKVSVRNAKELSLVYSPGVAEPCKEIAADPALSYQYTNRGNTVAVISDGTAILGLGDIGPEAGLPVMEGKAILFKNFADIDGFPICLGTKDVNELVQAVKWLEPTFGGINLEDISGPRCFEIEERLKETLNIPVFHDDQHGTAVICCAGLINALKVVGKELTQAKVVVSGAGAAGIAISKMLINIGIKPTNVRLCDKDGLLYPGGTANPYQERIALLSNPHGERMSLAGAMEGADAFYRGIGAGHCQPRDD